MYGINIYLDYNKNNYDSDKNNFCYFPLCHI